jgi:hypothetical protein
VGSSSSSTKGVTWAFAIVGVMALAGCSTAPRYEGATPSIRSVSGYQDMKYSFVGMDFNFVADQPGGYHRPIGTDEPMSTATASAAD